MTARSSLITGALRASPGRTRLMIAVIAVGVGAVGTILGGLTVIDRTIAESFASTNPAAAVLAVSGDATDAEAVALEVAGVSQAEARREVTVRLESAEGWQPLTLVAVGDVDEWRVGRAFPESGAWPPLDGQVVIERASIEEVALKVGDVVEASSPGGAAELTVAGLAHDPGRTPAWMTGEVVGYVTPATMESIGVGSALDKLALITSPDMDRQANAAVAAAVAEALRAEGLGVTRVSVPEPSEHPATGVMRTLLYLLQAFGLISFVASVGLVATLVVAEVKRSAGSIAIMKAGGATSGQVAGVYLTALAVIAAAGLVGGVVLSGVGTWGLSAFALGLLNIDGTSFLAEWWVFPIQAVIAIAVPVGAATIPIRRLSSRPVRESLTLGATAPARAPRRTRVAPRTGRVVAMGVRNAFRQPGRLTLTATSLAVGAAAVMTALNTGAAWDRVVDAEFETQNYDVQATLTEPVAVGSLDVRAAREGLTRVEYWNVSSEAVTGPEGEVSADATILSAPQDSTSSRLPLVEGRHVAPTDDHTVVISQALAGPALGVGDTLTVAGDDATWNVVGVVRALAGGEEGAAWVSQPLASMEQGAANTLRVSGSSEASALVSLERALAGSESQVLAASTSTGARQSLDDHLYIITALLLVMSIGLGLVGALGLVEAMSTAVAERRGEIGIMKTVGAASPQVIRMVVVEALVVVALAMVAGIVVAIPMTAVVETAVGEIFLGTPLLYTWWLPGVAIAAAVMAAAGAASSIVPAYEAADMPVREAFARA